MLYFEQAQAAGRPAATPAASQGVGSNAAEWGGSVRRYLPRNETPYVDAPVAGNRAQVSAAEDGAGNRREPWADTAADGAAGGRRSRARYGSTLMT
jgi:hypothetical protein